ncbi:MAG TPA: hypothetical protein VGU02_04015 [Gaiellaceae bacterium]|nr:hypothetical protein [Gaiellaceae bacterium]
MAATAAAALLLAGSALADQSYTDSTGEVAGSADISAVAVSNNPTAATVTFTVTTNLATLDSNSFFGIVLDSDVNASTGVGGFDYLIGMDSTGAAVINTTTQAGVPETQSSFSAGVWTITVPAADIGKPTAFNFGAFTDVGDQNNPIEDDAPDNGVFTYTMVQPPPPPPPPPAPQPKPTVSSVSVKVAGAATHGKSFRISGLSVNLSTGVVAKATGLKCTATLGGKHLAGSGAGGCTFRLPGTAKGKSLVVKVHGAYHSNALAKTYTTKVK